MFKRIKVLQIKLLKKLIGRSNKPVIHQRELCSCQVHIVAPAIGQNILKIRGNGVVKVYTSFGKGGEIWFNITWFRHSLV